jgi:hypothetical protein
MYKGYNDTNANINSYLLDCTNDLKRWVSFYNDSMEKYCIEKYYYELEKELKINDEETLEKLNVSVSDYKKSLKCFRMGIDWYKKKFCITPKFLSNYYNKLREEMDRLKKIKTYLNRRSKVLSFRKQNNIRTKRMALYVKIRISAIDILFTKKYDNRKINNNIIPIRCS